MREGSYLQLSVTQGGSISRHLKIRYKQRWRYMVINSGLFLRNHIHFHFIRGLNLYSYMANLELKTEIIHNDLIVWYER